jgi:2-oxoglutarate ferredoxin oxidoreductase subunit beta
MNPVNPVAVALIGGATFVARGFSGDQKNLVEIMKEAIMHSGFAFVDILQPCVTWNRDLTWAFYNKRVYSLQKEGHDTANRMLALQKAYEDGEKIPVGVFFRTAEPDLASGLAIPKDGRLKDQVTDKAEVQAVIDEMMI